MYSSEAKLKAKSAVRDHVRDSVNWNDPNEEIAGLQVSIMVDLYIDRWFDSDYQRFRTVEPEAVIVSDVVNPKTGRSSRTFRHASKIDVVVFDTFNNCFSIVEHKSTSENLQDQASEYFRRLTIDSQVSKYILSSRQDGKHDVRECLYDVIKRPDPKMKPKNITKADVPKIVETGRYCGRLVPEETLRRVREAYEADKGPRGGFNGTLNEDAVLYGLRLYAKVSEDFDGFFGRRCVVRTDGELEEYARELWQHSVDIRHARQSGIHAKNSSHCWNFRRCCEFLGVCTGEESEHSSNFYRPNFVHAELEADGLEGDGRDLLTNSRLVCFQNCRRKHFLKYELGLRQADETKSAALRWGSLLHQCLELVWGSLERMEG